MAPPPYDKRDATGYDLKPDFEDECRECGASPTVIVIGHEVPKTGLCGRHFFNDRRMANWELWSDNDTD